MGLEGHRVTSNVITGTRENDMWFASTDGDLYIQNLIREDGGVYICKFSGYEEKTIRLSIEGMFFFP